MKSFFDFGGRTEASRGTRRWSWTFLEVIFILILFLKELKEGSFLNDRTEQCFTAKNV
ncbi:hypothetical protein [Mesobacillus boroniphilus]|uniref:hypothetical protein n=1 Tax=Mesobacillus boroniphilus TaxID=308892 RepID=UPI0012E21725|nr:hypothetical protein [Mesobacillus boroniphilus]